jgi:hypothetical protein
MKKGLAIILMSCFMLSACLMGLSFHYCGGALKYISLVPDQEDEDCCGGRMNDKCCKDKIVKIEKKDTQQTIVKTLSLKPLFSFDLPIKYPIFETSGPERLDANLSNFHLRPPPLRTGETPLYIFYSVFRV